MKISLSPKQCKPLQFNAKFASLRFSSNLPHVSRFQAKTKGRTIKYLRGTRFRQIPRKNIEHSFRPRKKIVQIKKANKKALQRLEPKRKMPTTPHPQIFNGPSLISSQVAGSSE